MGFREISFVHYTFSNPLIPINKNSSHSRHLWENRRNFMT